MTGSARGIGKAIALRLARDGFDIVINDIEGNKEGIDSTVKEVEAIGRKGHGIACDVSDYEAVGKMIDEVVAKMGKLDVSVRATHNTSRSFISLLLISFWPRWQMPALPL